MSQKTAALILASGTGSRLGADTPKQYLPLLGRRVVDWSLRVLQDHPLIDKVYVAVHPDHAVYYAGLDAAVLVTGGATRQDSARQSLAEIAEDRVLIHDAARPCLTADLVTRLCTALDGADAAAPVLPVADTVRRADAAGHLHTESREGLMTVSTPQAFNKSLIQRLHTKYANDAVTDDAALCEKDGIAVVSVTGDRNNIKITHAEDLPLAEQILSSRLGDIRTGKGYDVHKLVSPKHDLHRLMLCGIPLPHDKVLDGHSDADVALHALTDAILGTICDGDIGAHFSPSDARWKNADSAMFLRHAADLVAKTGGAITHADITIMCERPKIGPHRDAMRARVADILSLPIQRVSVKATTTEGLGFAGRGEGIIAEAVATVRLPFAIDAVNTAAARYGKTG